MPKSPLPKGFYTHNTVCRRKEQLKNIKKINKADGRYFAKLLLEVKTKREKGKGEKKQIEAIRTLHFKCAQKSDESSKFYRQTQKKTQKYTNG